MGNLKDAHVFSNGKGSIAKFFQFLAINAASLYTSQVSLYLIKKEPFEWWGHLLTVVVLSAIITVVYFIARFLAYRTKIFPNTENREGIHGVSFFFLLIIAIVLLLVFI